MIICLILTFIVFLYLWYLEYEQTHSLDEELFKIASNSFNRGYVIGILSIILSFILGLLINLK